MASLHWRPLGKLFDPQDESLNRTPSIFAQSPQALVFDDKVRVYFSTRVLEEESGKYLSHVAYIDMAPDFSAILSCSNHEVISLGDLGCFDEHGIFPFSPFQDGSDIYGYTCGWSRRVSVSVETATGFAQSLDGGKSFEKVGHGPVFGADLHHPMLVGDSFVRKYNERYHMWYMFGTKWVKEHDEAQPDRVYKIGHAVSDDMINWEREHDAILPDVLHDNECQALPSVLFHNGYYHMVFCYRDVFGFRDDPARGYRLGYARSFDLRHWVRDDTALDGLNTQRQDWDQDMMCYPHFVKSADRVYLLYNGNAFGKGGFGGAVLEELASKPVLKFNTADADDIQDHFKQCDPDFLTDLAARTDLDSYIAKILDRAERYELWQNQNLVGFLAVYHNPSEGFDFITNISIIESAKRQGLGEALLDTLFVFSKRRCVQEVRLEVSAQNKSAISFYKKHGFLVLEQTQAEDFVTMVFNFNPT